MAGIQSKLERDHPGRSISVFGAGDVIRGLCPSASGLNLMAFGNSPSLVPEGHRENSPAFQRREVRFKNHRVPEGRKKIRFKSWIFCRPSGTCLYARLNPALKRRAIFTMSLRDTPLPEFPKGIRAKLDAAFTYCSKTEMFPRSVFPSHSIKMADTLN